MTRTFYVEVEIDAADHWTVESLLSELNEVCIYVEETDYGFDGSVTRVAIKPFS